ncbi:kinase [Dorcoceras hygrometricum]|uniref:Kinase n=1 Tax=Dorcoceras hygrometricum TaxID=472368 RepID=A0A2Z7B498_9LAMI|nr:kinase [Dorcoceras hygrometricum]
MPRVGQPRGVDFCGSLYTLSFPGSDVSLGDEIWLAVERLEEGNREVSVRSKISEKYDPLVFPLVSSFGATSRLDTTIPVLHGNSTSKVESLIVRQIRSMTGFQIPSVTDSDGGDDGGRRPRVDRMGEL